MQRLSMLSAITINVPNAAQPGNASQPFTVVMTTTQVITDDQGKQIGSPFQQQQPVIASDLAPTILTAINAQLAYTGFALTPVAVEPSAGNA